MHIIRKKSTSFTPQSPPQEMNMQNKNKTQKNAKDQASKTISQNTISGHVKRAIEGITSKIEKSSIEKIIIDAETDEGCDCLINSFIDAFDNNSMSDTIILKSLEVIYILLHTSNSTFRAKLQLIMPEILTITTLNFKKSKVKFRNSVHELAKAIYLNLQRQTPLPSPSQLGLPENFSQFIPIGSGRNCFTANITANKSSFDFENDNDNYNVPNIIDDNACSSKNDIINNLTESFSKQQASFNLNNSNAVPNKDYIDDDLIDCEDADKLPNENNNQIDDLNTKNDQINDNSMIELNEAPQHPSNAKQALDEYFKKNGEESNVIINHQESENKESYDNLLLVTNDSFDTSSNILYSNESLSNNEQDKNNSKDIIESLLEPEPITTIKPRRQKKNFNISKTDLSNSPNIPRSQSLNVNMPLVIDQNLNSNLASGSQLIPSTQYTSNHELIDSNQIIDLTKPASSPNSPTTSLTNTTQNSFLDSILNSQPNTSPSKNYDSPSPFNPLSPSAFNPPSDFNSPDSTSNYNSESTSNFLLNSNQYSSQVSKSNTMLNSNIGLGSQLSQNSISDSILKISPSKSSTIQILDSPSTFSSNIRLNPSNTNISSNKNSDSSTLLQTNDNNIHLNPNLETKRPSSSRFNVKHEHLSSNKQLNEDNIRCNVHQTKSKKNFKIEKRTNSPQSDNTESMNITQVESPVNSSFSFSQKQDYLFNKYDSSNTGNFTSTTSNNFSDQDLLNTSVQANNNNNDDFQASKPSFGLDDLDDQFEPITPVQSSNMQIFGNDDKKSPIPSPSILSTSETNSTGSEQFIPITPTRDSIIPKISNDRFDISINSSNDQKDSNSDQIINNNNEANTESDDQFVPITPVKNSLNFLDDDLFAKSKSEGASFNSDQFVPITPVKDNQLLTEEDEQFVPITPVKNTIDPLFDGGKDSSNDPITPVKENKNANNNKNGSFDQFVPLSPSVDKDIISFSDDPIQKQNNNSNIKNSDSLLDQFDPISKSDNDVNNPTQNSNSDNSLYDQFVPISPVTESIIPIFNASNSESSNDTNFHSIMRNRRNVLNDFNNNDSIMGNSPRSRRHLSFDSGIFSPGSASDKFEAITPPNARSMFYINQNYNNNINNVNNNVNNNIINNNIQSETEVLRTIPISKPINSNSIVITDGDKSDSKLTDSSFIDQFEPITPPSSIQNRSHIDDLINSGNNNNNDLNQTENIFNQTNKNVTKFDENLDKKLNALNSKNGTHPSVSFEITKKRKNNDSQKNELDSFELIDSMKNASKRDTNSDINFDSLNAINFSKSNEHFKNDPPAIPSSNKSQNPIDVKTTGSKNNQTKRFNVYIERAPLSPQLLQDNDIKP